MIEQQGELDAGLVRIVIAAPDANQGYWRSPSAQQSANWTAPTVSVSNSRSCSERRTRFVVYDTAGLIDAGEPTSDEFKQRHRVVAAPSPDDGA